MLTTFASLYDRIVIRHPAAVLLGLAVVLVVAVFGLPKFKLDASSDSLTLESDRALDYFREITSRYNSGDILVVTYNPEEELFSDDSLDRLQSLRDELLDVEGIESATSILDVPMLYSPPLSFRDLSDELPRLRDESIDWEMAQEEFHRNPIYKDTLVGPDNRTTAILLNLRVNHELVNMVRERDALYIERRNDELDEQEARRLERLEEEYLQARTQAAQKDAERVQTIRDIVAKYEGGADMFVGGATMITSDMISFIKSDLVTFGIGILAFIVVALIVIFRHPKLVLLPLCTCVVTAILMLGLLGWLDWRLTVISSNFISLLLIITMAITIHLVVRYQENCRVEPDQPQTRLVMDTVSQMGRPCFYTAITTIVAFVSLVVSDIRPVIDFGWMMTLGVAVALVVTFLIVPAGLLVMGGISKSNIGPEDPRYMSWLARQVLSFPTTILVVAALVAVVSFYGISQLKVENRFIDYFKDDTEIHQ
ncbi:MAG: MMPL family transporter, partial [Pseudomonadales bacterium]